MKIFAGVTRSDREDSVGKELIAKQLISLPQLPLMLIVRIHIENLILYLPQGIFSFVVLVHSQETSFWKQIPAYAVPDTIHQVDAFSRYLDFLRRSEAEWVKRRNLGYDAREIRLRVLELDH